VLLRSQSNPRLAGCFQHFGLQSQVFGVQAFNFALQAAIAQSTNRFLSQANMSYSLRRRLGSNSGASLPAVPDTRSDRRADRLPRRRR
jgi:hypothetical protein